MRFRLVLLLIGTPLFLAVMLTFGGMKSAPFPNKFLLGESALVEDAVEFPCVEAQSLNGSTREDVLSVRAALIDREPAILSGRYKLSSLFDEVSSELPWFSLRGMFIDGRSPHASEGYAADARYILNPFLLVGADFWGLTIWSGHRWKREEISDKELEGSLSSFYVRPSVVHLNPKQRIGSVRYNLSTYLRNIEPYSVTKPTLSQANFGISALNARDLGFSYYFLNLPSSQNIANAKQGRTPIPILDSLRHGAGVCEANIDCMYSLAPPAEMDTIQIQALPAKAVVYLWYNQPEDADAPDMVYSIEII